MGESGSVGAVCFHGLRFLNTHGAGERHIHAIALLGEILQERSDIKHFRCRHDSHQVSLGHVAWDVGRRVVTRAVL